MRALIRRISLTIVLAAGVSAAQLPVAAAQAAVSGEAARPWLEQAAKHAQELPPGRDRDKALDALSHFQVRAGMFAEANAAGTAIKDDAWRASSLAFLARFLREAGDVEAARKTVADACAVSLATEDESASGFGDWYLIRELVALGQYDEAEKFTRALPRQFGPTVELGVLIDALAKAGKFDEALRLAHGQQSTMLVQSIKAIATVDDSEQRVAQLIAIAEAIPDAKVRDGGFADLAIVVERAGRQEQADALVGRIETPDVLRRIESQLARRRSRVWNAEQLAAAVAAAPHREEKLALLRRLSRTLANDDRTDEAEQAIEQMREVIRQSSRSAEESKFGRVDDSAALLACDAGYLLIADALLKQGDRARAKDAVKRAAKSIAALPAESGLLKIMLLEILVRAQIGVDDLDGALRFMRDEANDEKDYFTLPAETLAAALIKADRVEEGLEMAELIRRKRSGKGRAAGQFASTLIANGRTAQAKQWLAAEMKDDADSETNSDAHDELAEAYREAARSMIEHEGDAALTAWLAEMDDDAAKFHACLGAAAALVPEMPSVPAKGNDDAGDPLTFWDG